MGKNKKGIKKGKKPHKNKPTSRKYAKYNIDSGRVIRERYCPRCGPGVFLQVNKGKLYCGKCHYTEFESKSSIS